MKNHKISPTIFYILSALFNLAAVILFTQRNTSLGTIFLCLGSSFLCFGAASSRKNSENKDAESTEDGKDAMDTEEKQITK